MKYKHRSAKIREVFEKLLQTFETNLADATSSESGSQATYDKLMKSKTEQREAAQEALQKLEKENGARGMAKSDALDQLDLLKKQVADDKKYIEQTTKTLDEKKAEWQDRCKLREEELAAISKAISILYADDARDTFSSSFKSQGPLFLQEGYTATERTRRRGAVETLRAAAHKGKDVRLLALASRIASTSHFTKVVQAIDKMVAMLKREETDDLDTKETCEKDRANDSRKAAAASRAIDDMTDDMAAIETEAQEASAQIKELQVQVKALDEQLAEATKVRDAEVSEYKASKKDDEQAVTILQQAKQVLAEFYKKNKLMLTQQPVVKAGEAPPPPPATWDAPYGGRTAEAKGILEILAIIIGDVEKDMATAKKSEDEAQSVYDKTVKTLSDDKSNLANQILTLTGTKGTKLEDIATIKANKASKKGELKAVMRKLKDSEPSCLFFTVNYAVRTKNRHIEIDALLKAKAILSGASYSSPANEDRELKPGDAFVQRPLQLRA